MEKFELYLGFVKFLGTDIDENNIYEFIFTDNIDEFWGENFEVKPCGLCNNLMPDKRYITMTKTIKTDIKFDVVIKSNCFSMGDCMDGIIALAWENIDDYDEYPDDRGRLFFRFGDNYSTVEKKLAIANILFEEDN